MCGQKKKILNKNDMDQETVETAKNEMLARDELLWIN